MKQVPLIRGPVEHTLDVDGDERSMEEFFGSDLCTPLFVHEKNGRLFVRWKVPPGRMPGLEDLTCPCCDGKACSTPDGGFVLDAEYTKVKTLVEVDE